MWYASANLTRLSRMKTLVSYRQILECQQYVVARSFIVILLHKLLLLNSSRGSLRLLNVSHWTHWRFASSNKIWCISSFHSWQQNRRKNQQQLSVNLRHLWWVDVAFQIPSFIIGKLTFRSEIEAIQLVIYSQHRKYWKKLESSSKISYHYLGDFLTNLNHNLKLSPNCPRKSGPQATLSRKQQLRAFIASIVVRAFTFLKI